MNIDDAYEKMDFKPHPNLSNEINHNIAQSEVDGGCDWSAFPEGKTLHMQTLNTHYTLQKRGGKSFIRGHAKFCPDWTLCHINGSTWGGSMLKMNFIGRGMRLEFWTEPFGTITTSTIQEITEE